MVFYIEFFKNYQSFGIVTTYCGCSLTGKAFRCQRKERGFDPRRPLQFFCVTFLWHTVLA